MAYTRILLLLETSSACFQRCIEGVAAFARSAPDWMLHTAEPGVSVEDAVRACRPDAVIARFDAATAKLLKRRRIPAEFVYIDGSDAGVGIANDQVGALAAEHLAELGLHNFGFYGFDWTSLPARFGGFAARLKELGRGPAAVFWPHIAEERGMWPLKNDALAEWLKALPKPAGVFAGNDLLAFEIAQHARLNGIQIPEQLAVLGVDDDPMFCALAAPDLSSVKTPDLLVGHTAASRLRRRLAGDTPLEAAVRLPALGLAIRRSTDMTALGDPDLAAALAFVRANAHMPIGVEDVIERVGISRRSLEGKFKAILKRTPLEEIRRVRIERAKTLLLDWNLPIAQVARDSGFDSAEWLAEVFRRETGMTPSEFRKRHAVRTE